ncbi:hypothetical protein M404DRAFT_713400 [Pisolithus tinctorius Marx 270]|uniref:Uncharacterized protein n=1 Tax=Pisolithus tinctorius Marx 270 TaxID=870435 RepID=A0A0C3NMK2_PISTI|nr:hypothetical protein M404DRAFT_713400 [Pisolithus tinctorius Marx 270]
MYVIRMMIVEEEVWSLTSDFWGCYQVSHLLATGLPKGRDFVRDYSSFNAYSNCWLLCVESTRRWWSPSSEITRKLGGRHSIPKALRCMYNKQPSVGKDSQQNETGHPHLYLAGSSTSTSVPSTDSSLLQYVPSNHGIPISQTFCGAWHPLENMIG